MQVNITMGHVKDLQNREIAELRKKLANAALVASKYTNRDNLRLLCGELSPQEMRTAVAVADAIAREIERLERE